MACHDTSFMLVLFKFNGHFLYMTQLLFMSAGLFVMVFCYFSQQITSCSGEIRTFYIRNQEDIDKQR